MPSESLNRWRGERRKALDQIATAHAAVGGTAPGRRYATKQINHAYIMLLSGQFQGFCRDLHSEAADSICGPSGARDERMSLLYKRLTTGRKLDTGNPNSGNLGSDFGFFDIALSEKLKNHDPGNGERLKQLEDLNNWRNAVAHENFDPTKLFGTISLTRIRRWRRICEELAVEMDVIIGSHVATITKKIPW